MPSDQENLTSLNPNIKPQNLHRELAKIQPGESPLDYIARNISAQAGTSSQADPHEEVQQILVEQTVKALTPEIPQKTALETSKTETSTDPLAAEYDLGGAPKSVETDSVPEGEEPKGLTLAENLKRLRTSHKETTKKLKEVEELKSSLEKEVDDYKKGNTIPEKIQEYENKISELSYFQKLHNFKASEEYQEKFQKPITEAQVRLNAIAADYQIPQEVMNEALNYSSGSELNGFLAEHFDVVGAVEVKGLIQTVKDTHSQALEAEKIPLEALTRLQEENKVAKEVHDRQRKQVIATRSKDAWTRSLTKIQAAGKLPELVYSSSDSEHNNNIVKPILTAASIEYGKMVRMLAEAGLKELNPELAEALANAVLWGHSSAVSVAQREEAVRYAEDLHKTMARTAKFDRPNIGAPRRSPNGTPSQPQELMTPRKAADELMAGVLRK